MSKKQRTFLCDDLPKRCFVFFDEMRNNEELCDVRFQLGDEFITAHRVIIAAVIPHFRRLLSNSVRNEDIVMPHVEINAFRRLLHFAYTREIKIDSENVREILFAASYLGVNEVREACCDFLADTLEPENVVRTLLLADELNCFELLESSHCYIKENFTEVSQTKEFLTLPFDYMRELIGEDDLNIKKEEEALRAVMKWANEFPEERSSQLSELLLKIRMPLIEPLYLTNVVKTEKLIQTSVLCKNLLDEARNFNLSPQPTNSVCSFQIAPRQSVKNNYSAGDENLSIYLLSCKLEFSVQYCDPLQEKWFSETSTKLFINDGSFAELLNKVYFFDMSYTIEFDPENRSCEFYSTMPTRRTFAGATPFGNKIYICGGKEEKSASKAVECFDPEQDKWEIMSSIPTACWGLSAVALEKNIYILGGKDEYFVYDHVHSYDAVRKQWKAIPSMLNRRCFAGAAVLNGKIYICGGATDLNLTMCTATAEVYDPLTNVWEYIASMNSSRCHSPLVTSCGKLYVLGGEREKDWNSHVPEMYDPQKDEWLPGLEKDLPRVPYFGAVAM